MSKQAPHGPTSDADLLEWLRAEHAQPFEGWDFSYLNERRVEPAKHKRWDLHRLIGAVWAESHSVLDVETGRGERMAEWDSCLRQQEADGGRRGVPTQRSSRLASAGATRCQGGQGRRRFDPIPRCQLRPDQAGEPKQQDNRKPLRHRHRCGGPE